MAKQFKNILATVVFTLVGVALMGWIYRGFDFRPLREVFAVRDNYLWIVLALLVGVLANVFRSLRWRMLLMGAGIPIKRRRAIELVFISYLINSVTPRLGELTRSVLVRRGDVKVMSKALGTVGVEKLADVVCLLLVVILAVSLRWDDTQLLLQRGLGKWHIDGSSFWLYTVACCLICAVLVVIFLRIRQMRKLIRLMWEGMLSIGRLPNFTGFIGLCIGIWICNFLQLYLLVPCFKSLSSLSVVDAFFLFGAASIGVLLPTPGGAGPWHFAIVKTLTGIFGANASVAKMFALVTHGLKTALIILLGLLAYVTFYWDIWTKTRKKEQLKK